MQKRCRKACTHADKLVPRFRDGSAQSFFDERGGILQPIWLNDVTVAYYFELLQVVESGNTVAAIPRTYLHLWSLHAFSSAKKP
jgi:hypothetical protein